MATWTHLIQLYHCYFAPLECMSWWLFFPPGLMWNILGQQINEGLVDSGFSSISVMTILGFPSSYYNLTTPYPVHKNHTVSPSSVADAKGWQGISSVREYNLAPDCLEALWALLSSSVAILILEWLSEYLLPISVICVCTKKMIFCNLVYLLLKQTIWQVTTFHNAVQSVVLTLVSPLWQLLHRDNRMLVAN